MEPRAKAEAAGKPLATFAIIGYNQGKYIREAIKGAFQQTYSPLEIILSDDNSPDGTFAIMEEAAAAYCGPHTIVLNKNPHNLGIGGHASKVTELARGKLIIVAAGDDVSFKDRVEQLVGLWLENGSPEYCSLFSGVIQKNDLQTHGKAETAERRYASRHPAYIMNHYSSYHGSSHAWTRATFDFFGPLHKDVVNEDEAILVRNQLLGPVLAIDKPLVMHRLHDDNTGSSGWGAVGSPKNLRSYQLRLFSRRRALVACMLADIERVMNCGAALAKIDSNDLHAAKVSLNKELLLCDCGIAALMRSKSRIFSLCVRCFFSNVVIAKSVRSKLLGYLYPSLYLLLRKTKSLFRTGWRCMFCKIEGAGGGGALLL